MLEDAGVKTVKYLYDFGDGWEHTVKIERITDAVPGLAYPILIDAAGRCPPEDVGGSWGYAEFLDALADPAHENHAEMKDWIGETFDPKAVDVEALSNDVAALAKGMDPQTADQAEAIQLIRGLHRMDTFHSSCRLLGPHHLPLRQGKRMKHNERSKAAINALEAQRDNLVAWFKKSPEEREADLEKVLQTIDTQGVVAGRRMMAALGLPTIPDELCDPPNVLEVRHAQDRPERNEAERPGSAERFDH